MSDPPGPLMRRSRLGLGILVALLVAGTPFVLRAIVPDNSLDVWFVEGDPALAEYERFQETFGNDEVILIGYRPGGDVLGEEPLERVAALGQRLRRIEGVADVHSIAEAEDVVRDGFGYSVVRLRDHFDYDVDAMREVLLDSPLSAGRLINADATMALIWVQMAALENFEDVRDDIVVAVRAEADAVLGASHAYVGGLGVIYTALNQATQRDFGVFMGVCYVLLLALLGAVFRRASVALVAMGVVGITTWLTLAVAGLFDRPLNAVTVTIPTLIAVFALADIVHVLNHHTAAARRLPGAGAWDVAREALRRAFTPSLYTSLTTAAGFLALTSAPIAALRQFGALAATGIALAFAVTFVLGAIALPRLRPASDRSATLGAIELGLERLFRLVWARPLATAAVVAVIAVVAAFGAGRVTADTYTIGYLPDDDRATRDHLALESEWGPYTPVDLVVRPLGGRRVDDPAMLRASASFSDAVQDRTGVASAFGLHTLVGRYSEVRVGDDRLMDDSANVALAMERLEDERNADLRRISTADYRAGRIVLTGPMMSARDLGRTLSDVQEVVDAHFAGLAEVAPAGYPPLYVQIVERVTSSQVRSFWIALVMVTLLLAFCLRDLRLALLAVPVNLFPILIMFGTMGWLGIPLDVATATVAAILLGVAVDDTIHLLYHVRGARATAGTREALFSAARGAGRAVVLTSLILAVGFSVLMLASVSTVFYFGLLTAVAAVGALVGDLVLLPLLLRVVYGRAAAEPAS
ncbi:MAG: MMPL family transporter [Rhodothermales bacterium]